ncbi:TonB-dependent receptor, partial [Rhodothermus marinus]|uniref:TonB-dependent receptor n=1 Tax=Rhodothermus marinus TaxID=29549 RepID=UPI001FB339A0
MLEARTGLFVKRYGSGGLATLSLRGSGATQTLLLIDGHRVADPQSGLIDLTLLPTVLLSAVRWSMDRPPPPTDRA